MRLNQHLINRIAFEGKVSQAENASSILIARSRLGFVATTDCAFVNRPNGARENNADLIVSGDKDLLEWLDQSPPVMTPRTFLERAEHVAITISINSTQYFPTAAVVPNYCSNHCSNADEFSRTVSN